MNKRPFLILSLFLLLFSFDGQAADTYRPEISVAGFIPLPDCGRQVYNFNPGWRFFKGDIRGAEAVNFDDRSWEVVSTPHTVELMPARERLLTSSVSPRQAAQMLSCFHPVWERNLSASGS